jgi:hypothetical protein
MLAPHPEMGGGYFRVRFEKGDLTNLSGVSNILSSTALGMSLAAGVTALTIAAAPVAASADTDPPTSAAKVLFSDDFTSGFSTAPGGRWVNDFGGVDGKTTTSARGLQVLPAGVNPATHLPAFTVTSPQSSGDKLGFADHTKYMATPAVTTNEGLGGFDVPSDGALTCTTTDLAVTTTGTAANPFGKNVTNPGSDLRLGSGSANSFDPANDTVFDFFTTNTEIYAYYERLRLPGTTYAAFTYAVPVASTTPGRANTYQVTIGNHQSTATWILNGNPVLTVNKIGTRALPDKYKLVDNGGTDEVVKVDQLDCGISTFTLLDGVGANGRGLVREDSDPGYYTSPTAFFDNDALARNRLFGQGVDLQVRRFAVTTTR